MPLTKPPRDCPSDGILLIAEGETCQPKYLPASFLSLSQSTNFSRQILGSGKRVSHSAEASTETKFAASLYLSLGRLGPTPPSRKTNQDFKYTCPSSYCGVIPSPRGSHQFAWVREPSSNLPEQVEEGSWNSEPQKQNWCRALPHHST